MSGDNSASVPLLRRSDASRRAVAYQPFAEDEVEGAYERSEQVEVTPYEKDEGHNEDDDYLPKFSWKKLWIYTGPGFLMSIAYLDPGNIESDLQVGAQTGYTLLWLLMWATFMGLIIQLLAARLGVATGRHLAELCKDAYPVWARMALWVLTEIAIIGADIQEVIGSAIAFRILSNGRIPLWGGVLITGIDGFLFLFLENFGVRKLEALFGAFISVMALSFAWMFIQAEPDGRQTISGLIIPRIPANALDKAVGIVGAVIMPHNIFLHSALVQSRAIDTSKKSRVRDALRYYSIESAVALLISLVINVFIMAVFAKGFYGKDEADSIGLLNAGEYLQREYGGSFFPILYIWAIGLLAAGQSSTMTGTYTGQFVMAGFLNLRVKKWTRVFVTRSVAIIPTILVALLFDTSDNQLDVANEWLNVLQSIQLPFALIPLLALVANERIMGTFVIGSTLKVISWLIAVLVLVINGYLIVAFFFIEMASSVSAYAALFVASTLYVGFVVYLVLQPLLENNFWKLFKPNSSSSGTKLPEKDDSLPEKEAEAQNGDASLGS